MPLNTYVSLNRKVFDEDSDKSLIELVQEVSIADPEELLINKEEYTVIESMVTELLSPFEREVLKKYLAGTNYHDIAKELNKPVKSVDNALQRLKKKIEKSVQEIKAEELE